MKRLVWLWGYLLIAGCFQERGFHDATEPPLGGRQPGADLNELSNGTIPLEPLPNGTVPQAPRHLVLESCSMWDAYHSVVPREMVPAEPPAGWENNGPVGDVIGNMGVTAFTCGRVGLGPFERGPIEILFDRHSLGTVPSECPASTTDSLHPIIIQVILNDQEIANFLNVTYGMPAKYGRFNHAIQELASGAMRTVTWSVGDGEESSVNILEDQIVREDTQVHRYWWVRGEGMGQLAMDLVLTKPEFGSRAAHGTFVDPMAMAQIAGGQFLGLGNWYPSVVSSNTFELYSDHYCSPL